MKAYKITNNGRCRDITYEVGKTYKFNGKIALCQHGFHCCKNPDSVLDYYVYTANVTKIFELDVSGKIIEDENYNKFVTDKFKVIREIPTSEYNMLFKYHVFDFTSKTITITNAEDPDNIETYEYDRSGNSNTNNGNDTSTKRIYFAILCGS